MTYLAVLTTLLHYIAIMLVANMGNFKRGLGGKGPLLKIKL